MLSEGVSVGTGYWRWDRQAALKKGIEILMTRGIERAICCGSWIRFLSKYVGAPILSLKQRVDKYFSEEAKVLDLEWNQKFLCLFLNFFFFVSFVITKIVESAQIFIYKCKRWKKKSCSV